MDERLTKRFVVTEGYDAQTVGEFFERFASEGGPAVLGIYRLTAEHSDLAERNGTTQKLRDTAVNVDQCRRVVAIRRATALLAALDTGMLAHDDCFVGIVYDDTVWEVWESDEYGFSFRSA